MNERIAVIYGARTPMGKAGGSLKKMGADDLAVHVMKHVMTHSGVDVDAIDEVIVGNVSQPGHAANIARVIALEAGVPKKVPAFTVHRNCASGMEAISSAANLIWAGRAEIILAAGTESMSNIPLYLSEPMKNIFEQFFRARTALDKIKVLSQIRPAFLKPVIGVLQGLTDPVCGLNMGQTAEVLAKEFHISREEQDAFALQSHLKAIAAFESGFLNEEIVPLPIAPTYDRVMNRDEGPRLGQTIAQLQKLKPYFDRDNGTVTVGNACPITDGAACVMLMSESKAKELGLTPLGYIKDYAYAGLDGSRMGLGPVYATSRLLEQTHLKMTDFDLIELNEAFCSPSDWLYEGV